MLGQLGQWLWMGDRKREMNVLVCDKASAEWSQWLCTKSPANQAK